MLCYALASAYPVPLIESVVKSIEEGKVEGQKTYITWAAYFIAILLAKGVSYYWQNLLMGSLGQKVIRDLRLKLFSKIIYNPASFFNRNKTGDLISRFTTDLNTLNEAVIISITGPLRDLPLIFLLLGYMLYSSWQLFLLTLVLLPPTAFLINKFGLKNKKVITKRLNKYGDLSSLLTESITGIRVVKAFGMEKYEVDRFEKENQRLYNYFFRSIKIGSYSYPILELIGGICGAVILIFGGYLISNNEITSANFAAFLVSFMMLNNPIKKLNGFTLKVQEGSAAATRIFDIINEEVVIKESENAVELPQIRKGIDINIKEFRYPEEEKPVLQDINIELKAGTITALVGSSGSGKTTLANLIPRFYDLDSEQASIKIDGHDLREVTLNSLRTQIAIVTQEIILFNDTVKNNISYGNINCSEETILQAAKAAYAHDFIQQFPDGYEQQIGEKGVRLSGGQRQRLSISRALIKDAPILILDEATSALDTESEKEVQGAIENLMKNRTSLVIAHRLSTIQHADVIHVLKDGKIVESGSHTELLEKEGEYHRLYDLQFKS